MNFNIAANIRRELDEIGIAEVRDFFSTDISSTFAEELIASADRAEPSGGYKYSLKYDEIASHAIHRLCKSEDFAAFADEILRGLLNFSVSTRDIELGYSIIKNRGDRVPYHFDARNCLNFIFPIVLPARKNGHVDLICFPNVIGFRRSSMDRAVGRLITHFPIARSLFAKAHVSYRIGAMYAFYGCRTFHGVEAADYDGLRAVASVVVRWRA